MEQYWRRSTTILSQLIHLYLFLILLSFSTLHGIFCSAEISSITTTIKNAQTTKIFGIIDTVAIVNAFTKVCLFSFYCLFLKNKILIC